MHVTGWRLPALPLAVGFVAVVVLLDVLSGSRVVLVGLLSAAPLLLGLMAPPSVVARLGAAVILIAATSPLWNHTWGSWAFWVPLTVVALASFVAWRMAVDQETVRRLADELRRAEEQLQAILAHADVAVMVRSAAGELIYANQRAADLLDLPSVEAIADQTSAQLMDRFEVYDESGAPVALNALPGTRVLAGEPDPPAVLVRSVIRRTGRERWLLNRVTAIRGPEGGIEMAVNLIEDLTELKRSDVAQRLLASAARVAGAAGEVELTLQSIVEAAVPGLADWAGADLLERGGQVTTVAIAHQDRERLALGWRLRREWPVTADESGGVREVIDSGRSQLVSKVTDEMLIAAARDDEHLRVLRAVGLNSTIIVPIRAGTRILGALSFVSSTARRFDERDLQLAEDLGRQTGMLIANAQLQAERGRVAHTLAGGLLPDRLPALAGWSVNVAYRAAGAANEVGGDFYDVIEFDGGWSAVVGDVVGKGAEAAVLTALARHTLAAIIESTGDPLQALTVLNRRLRERNADGFANLCTVAAITVRGDRAEILSAGHPAPLLIRGAAVTALGRPGVLLGVVDELSVPIASTELRAGDQLLLYTDGVTDAVGARERFGDERLVKTLAALAVDGAEDVATRLLKAVDAFAVGDQRDDIAIVALRRALPATPALAA